MFENGMKPLLSLCLPCYDLQRKDHVILLWGMPDDSPLAQVYGVLTRLGYSVVLLDQHAVLQTEIHLTTTTHVAGFIRVRDQVIDLSTITAVYVRPYPNDALPVLKGMGLNDPLWNHALMISEALLSWLELTTATVVNRPSAMASNASKPYQACIIQSHGFHIPDTLITTDPDAALAFWSHHGVVIYKSISGVRSIVARLTPEHIPRLELLRWCPTQFQQYIPGKDYRVHVIGEEVFACEISSTGDDYRYASRQGCSSRIVAHDIAPEIADRCRTLTRALRLSVAGVDLRCHPDGRWYCFEVNPSPAYTYYQSATGLPMDEAIAHLLAQGCSH